MNFHSKISNFLFHFLQKLVISGPGNTKIWNLGIKIVNHPQFQLWEMRGYWVCWFWPSELWNWFSSLNSTKPHKKCIFLANYGLKIMAFDFFCPANVYGAKNIALKNPFISAEFDRILKHMESNWVLCILPKVP